MTIGIVTSILTALLTVYSISIIITYFYNVSITFPFSIEGAKATEFLQLLFYAPASYIIYNATKPNFKNFFKKR